jgi:hypothetical protein
LAFRIPTSGPHRFVGCFDEHRVLETCCHFKHPVVRLHPIYCVSQHQLPAKLAFVISARPVELAIARAHKRKVGTCRYIHRTIRKIKYFCERTEG